MKTNPIRSTVHKLLCLSLLSVSLTYSSEEHAHVKFRRTLLNATKRGDSSAIDQLLQGKVNIDNPSLGLALRKASYLGHVESVRCLIRHKANVNFRGVNDHITPLKKHMPDANTPLHCACLGITDANLEVIKILLQHGARSDMRSSFGKTPLEYAKYSIDYGCVEFYEAAKVLLTS